MSRIPLALLGRPLRKKSRAMTKPEPIKATAPALVVEETPEAPEAPEEVVEEVIEEVIEEDEEDEDLDKVWEDDSDLAYDDEDEDEDDFDLDEPNTEEEPESGIDLEAGPASLTSIEFDAGPVGVTVDPGEDEEFGTEDDEVTITGLSMSNTKAELVEAAETMGLKVSGLTKQQILDLMAESE